MAGAIGAGLITKWGVKNPLYEMHHESLIKLLSWAAVGTAALVSVALWRQWQQRHNGGSNREQWGAWLVAIAAALLTPLWLPLPAGSIEMPPLKEWLGIIWPFPVGMLFAAVGWLLTRPLKGKSLPAGDLWWLYAGMVGTALVPIRLFGQYCAELKAASVLAGEKVEEGFMRRLTPLLSSEFWLRHHTSGLMMVLAVLLAALMMWEGQR